MPTRFAPHLVPAPSVDAAPTAPAPVTTDAAACATLRVLVVDADPFVGWALAQHLVDTLGAEVDDAADVDAALQAVARDTVDVAVLDAAGMELATATAAVARLRTARPHLAVVVLRGEGATSRLQATVAGGVHWLPMRADADDLVTAVRGALAQARAGAGSAKRQLPRPAAPALTLSPREQQVLELLRDGHSLPSVAATLAISMSTTKTYVARLYDKLESTSRTQALLKAIRLGLLQPEAQRAG
ncbi:MAG: LuxR C-terminal-related transcriptional regulator [Jatrophihabitans sp.]|uniref:LuxR C-terminal-related transcriptional regulator n=1 Tax=Jatrophihabitans sp. TaxID=1932789 RepID=UPI003F8233AF